MPKRLHIYYRSTASWRVRIALDLSAGGRSDPLGTMDHRGRTCRLRDPAGRDRGPVPLGQAPTLADICLVQQLYNARRFGAHVSGFTRLFAAEEACNALPASAQVAPERQGDAE